MKKIVIFFIAFVTMIQSTYAATSALTESLLEYEAITSAIGTDPSFQNVISPTEFIIDIKRLTKEIDILGEVRYGILTRTLSDESDQDRNRCKHRHSRPIRYIATLLVSPNSGIGPNIVTVLSIVPASDHHHHH